MMDTRYIILWDPRLTGDFIFYDRLFYADVNEALKVCDEFNTGIFPRFKVVRVEFFELF